MKRFAILFVMLFVAAGLAGQTSKQAVNGTAANRTTANQTWIADVTIVSPENLDHVGKGSVLIEDDRIVRVERRQGRRDLRAQRWFRERDSILFRGSSIRTFTSALFPAWVLISSAARRR